MGVWRSLDAESFSEVDTSHGGVVEYGRGWSICNDVPLIDDVGAITDIEGVPDIVIRDQNAQSPFGEPFDLFLDFGNGNRIDPGKRFVQKHECGLGGERAGDFETAPLASGELFAP